MKKLKEVREKAKFKKSGKNAVGKEKIWKKRL